MPFTEESVFWTECEGSGRLAVVLRPRGGAGLDRDLVALGSQGVDVLVSLLPEEDARYLGLEDEGAAAERAGLIFMSAPIREFSVPESEEAFRAVVERAAASVRDGRSVAAHCRAGLGRSPLFVAAVLVVLGASEAEAWERVAHARGRRVPDTVEQRGWLKRVEAWRPAG
jgi:protein-tyrosine phosphatase